MNFIKHQSIDKAEYFLDSLVTRKSFKLIDNILNQLNHQYLLMLIMSKMQLETKISLNMKIHEVFKYLYIKQTNYSNASIC